MSGTIWRANINIDGMIYPYGCHESTVRYALNYKPNNGDIFLVSHPQSGATWVQRIIYLILMEGVPDRNKHFEFTTYLEYSGYDTIKFPVIKTHLPYASLPFNKQAKYLFLFRNPKDTVVSLYHHIRSDTDRYGFLSGFHDFFDDWINGKVGYGDYFTHTLDYWYHRFDGPYFAHLIYERMVDDPKQAVLKIGDFLGGQSFVDKLHENNDKLLAEVCRQAVVDKVGTKWLTFTRNETAGNWRSCMSRMESDLIDFKVKKYFAGTELEYLWDRELCYDY